MNNLQVKITVPDISDLTPNVGGDYSFRVIFRDAAGNYLNNPNIPNVYDTTAPLELPNKFTINVAIDNGTYLITGARISVYANENTDCCLATIIQDIENNNGEDPTQNFEITQPSCNGIYQVPGSIRIFNGTNRTRYKICYGVTTYNCPNCTVSDGVFNGDEEKVIQLTPPAQGNTQNSVMRIFNGNGCLYFTDIPITQTSPICDTPCTFPTLLSFSKVNPTCIGTDGATNADGQLVLNGYANVDRYQLCIDSYFSCTPNYDGAFVVPAGSDPIVIPFPLQFEAGQLFRDFTVRVYNGSEECYADESRRFNNPCYTTTPEVPTGDPVNACSFSATAGGLGGTRNYYWLNNTASPVDVYWLFDTNDYPDRLKVSVNNAVWYDSGCAGPLPGSCMPPGLCGYSPEEKYGKIALAPNSFINFFIDGDCSGMGSGTTWNFQSKCSPFATTPVTYTGTAPSCNIEITEYSADNMAGNGLIFLDRWIGGIPGQYEFGVQPESTADITTVTWIQDNDEPSPGEGMFFTGLTPGVEYRVWIRSKDAVSCNSFINVTIPMA